MDKPKKPPHNKSSLAHHNKEPGEQITIQIIPFRSFQPIWVWTGTIQDEMYYNLYKLDLPVITTYGKNNSFDMLLSQDEQLYELFKIFNSYPTVAHYKRKLLEIIKEKSKNLLPKPLFKPDNSENK